MKLIDADVLTEYCEKRNYNSIPIAVFKSQRNIDPVYAAGACYCIECKYFDPDENIAPNTGSCSFIEMVRFFDDFCSKGELKEKHDEMDKR